VPGRVFMSLMVTGYAVAAGLALADHLEAAIIVFAVASLLGAPLMRRR
jgi:membrane protein implicated in regulation of membrane protease activity